MGEILRILVTYGVLGAVAIALMYGVAYSHQSRVGRLLGSPKFWALGLLVVFLSPGGPVGGPLNSCVPS